MNNVAGHNFCASGVFQTTIPHSASTLKDTDVTNNSTVLIYQRNNHMIERLCMQVISQRVFKGHTLVQLSHLQNYKARTYKDPLIKTYDHHFIDTSIDITTRESLILALATCAPVRRAM